MMNFKKGQLFIYTGIFFIIALFCFALSNAGKSFFFELFQNFAFQKTVPTLKVESIADRKGLVILDVREKKEFDISHIPEAIWIGYSDFHPGRIESFPQDTPVLLYCTVGYRSEIVGRTMTEMGFSHLFNLKGGIIEWSNKGYPMTNGFSKTDSLHVYEKIWAYFSTRGIKTW